MFQQLKIKGNEYIILTSIDEEYLGEKDFNQRIIEYFTRYIKKNNKFKDIDFNNKKI